MLIVLLNTTLTQVEVIMKTIDRLNINNMTTLWHNYGASTYNQVFHHSDAWPNKVWLATPHSAMGATELLDVQNFLLSNQNHNLVAWDEAFINVLSADKNWQQVSSLQAMSVDLNTAKNYADQIVSIDKQFTLSQVSKMEDVMQWISSGSDGFGYRIDRASILNAIRNKSISLYSLFDTANDSSVPAGTAMLLTENNNVGIHQITLSNAYRGKGLGKKIMAELINIAAESSADTLTLQASSDGLPLYEKFGFQSSFSIRAFRPTIN
jgi:ribosomal protein S18 acetylase RimI-like enzyme